MRNRENYFLAIVSVSLYVMIGNYVMRHQGILLMSSYALLFVIYGWIIMRGRPQDVFFWIANAILFRAVLCMTMPLLSDDFYRFVWDGGLVANGINPYESIPQQLIKGSVIVPGIHNQLYSMLNSSQYNSVYPPMLQYLFGLASIIFPDNIQGSVVVIRLWIMCAEFISLFVMHRLLLCWHLPASRILLYALNPLVIIEITGNLHAEAFLVVFILLAFYALHKRKVWLSAISFALAVSFKLLPLIFLPWLFMHIRFRFFLIYTFITSSMLLTSFIPFFTLDAFQGFIQSITLYFNRFEFNASLYYLIRTFVEIFTGYNAIGLIGPIMATLSFLAIAGYVLLQKMVGNDKNDLNALSFVAQRWPVAMLHIATIYWLCSTTVHPWYIVPLLAYSVFTNHRYVVLWTALIFLTYIGYDRTSFHEQMQVVLLEYLCVWGYALYEIFRQTKPFVLKYLSRS